MRGRLLMPTRLAAGYDGRYDHAAAVARVEVVRRIPMLLMSRLLCLNWRRPMSDPTLVPSFAILVTVRLRLQYRLDRVEGSHAAV